MGDGINAMGEKLYILVGSDKHLDYIINLTKAAYEKGKEVQVFFSGRGVGLTMRPEFEQLVGKARLSICDISFRANGFRGCEGDVPGVDLKDFVTQAKNAEMVMQADRYIVF